MSSAPRTHVIRLQRAATPCRWVQAVGRTDDMGCVVTWHACYARRFTADTAQHQAARLQQLLGHDGTAYVAEPLPITPSP